MEWFLYVRGLGSRYDGFGHKGLGNQYVCEG